MTEKEKAPSVITFDKNQNVPFIYRLKALSYLGNHLCSAAKGHEKITTREFTE